MLIRNLAVLMGVAAFLASAQSLHASDVIPLKGTASYNKAQTTTLGSIGDADTELMRGGGGRGGGGHGGFHGGGFHGGYRGGFYGGYRGGFYGGYRGGFYGGYRGGYYAGYRGFGYGYGGYGYGGWGGYYPYYGGVYYYNPYYYPYYGGYGYVGGYNGGSPAVTVLSQQNSFAQPYSSYGAAPGLNNFAFGNGSGGGGYNGNGYNGNGYNGMPVAPPSADGTYPYNGGPTMPVPMPVQQQQQFNPAKTAPAVPSTLRLVSTPSQQPQQTSSYAYPAYGEDTRASGYAINRTIPTKQTNR